MSNNPNIFKVWSPDGTEMIETSRANARDLTTHAGWLSSPPTVIEKTIVIEVPVAAPAPVETPAAPAAPAAEEAPAETEEEAPAADDADEDAETSDEASEEAPALRTTEEAFADLPEREDVVAYLAANFPDFKPHHLMKREKLILKAIELATA